METIKIVIQASNEEILEESESFKIDSSWRSNLDLAKEINRFTKRAKNLTARWLSTGQPHTAHVGVDVAVTGLSGSVQFSKEVESLIKDMSGANTL